MGIRLAARGLHHLTDEPAEQRRLGLGLLDLVWIGGNDVIHCLLDGNRIGDLLQTALFDDFSRVAAFRPDDFKDVLGDLAGDRSGLDQIDDGTKLVG